MKLFYKRVGDTFSLDEYNAMCYLLSLQKYEETFDLTTGTAVGEYGEYSFVDTNDVLLQKQDGFVVLKTNEECYISINTYIPNAKINAKIKVYQYNTTLETNNITTVINPNELYDDINNSKYEEIETKTLTIPITNGKIKINPKTLELSKGDWISKEIKIIAEYTEPEINLEDGRANTESEIICETFEEIEQAINYLPEGEHIDIRLKGKKTYTFTKEIIIKNKSVTIEGGNFGSNSLSYLDGQNLFRHFYVGAGSTLHLKSCHLKNGNGSTINSYLDLPKRGGSIYIDSNFKTSKGYGFNPAFVTIENCRFSDCHANRGGAIYNNKSKLSCNTVSFTNCVATKDGDKTACWGGAIMTESVSMYHDSSNQLYIDKSETVYNSNKTIIDLNISETQNLKYFTNSSYTIPTINCICGNEKYSVTSVKTGQFSYILTVNGNLPVGSRFYFICNDFISRNLTVVKEGNKNYAVVVPEEVD